MIRKIFTSSLLVAASMLVVSGTATAGTVHLNSPEWLGHLKLDQKQLGEIKTAVEKALNAPIDAEQQCGKVRLDCVVRAAREWEFEGDKYREIVINIHTVGHASRAVAQEKGKWPAVAAK